MNTFKCPLRDRQFDFKDFWTQENKCSYCGSLNPDTFIEGVLLNKEITIDKVNKVFYMDNIVFDPKHCDDTQLETMTNFYNTGVLRVKNNT